MKASPLCLLGTSPFWNGLIEQLVEMDGDSLQEALLLVEKLKDEIKANFIKQAHLIEQIQ